MSQEITLNLIVLNQQGKPQFILEPKQQGRPASEPLPVAVAHAEPNDAASLFGENMQRQTQHIGGTTLGQILEKEQMA
jgi:hypothetical protein